MEKQSKAKQSESLMGNTNAKRSEYEGKVVRLSGADTGLLYDFFATEGNMDPSTADFGNAIHYALIKVYGRKVEDEERNYIV